MARFPYLGMVAFLLLYFYAASLYPGGTKFDPSTKGFSQIGNYWCDLLDSVSYSGKPNPGQPFALVANLILSFTLVIFWWNVPDLFKNPKGKRVFVRATGGLSMLLFAFLFASAHDLVIDLAAPLGFAALITTQAGLLQSKEYKSLGLSGVAILLGLTLFVFWQIGFMQLLLPAIQKAAFASAFAWIAFTNYRLGVLGRVKDWHAPSRSV